MNLRQTTEGRLLQDQVQQEAPAYNMSKSALPHRFSARIGAIQDGIQGTVWLRRLLNESDQTMVQIHRAVFNRLEYQIEHSQLISLLSRPCNLTFDASLSHQYAKICSREKAYSLSVRPVNSPFYASIKSAQRKNLFDYATSYSLFRNHDIFSRKHTLRLGYTRMQHDRLVSVGLELATSTCNVSNTARVDFEVARKWDLFSPMWGIAELGERKPKLRVINHFKGGFISGIGSSEDAEV